MFDIGFSISPQKAEFAPLLFPDDLSRGMQSAKKIGLLGSRIEFAGFNGAIRRTLRQFIGGYQRLSQTVRDFIIPNPEA